MGYDKILGYLELGKKEGAEVLIGGGPANVEGFSNGFYVQPTLLKGNNDMRVFQEDIELALDAAHKAKAAWGKTSVTERSNLILKIADRIEANLEALAVAETWDNGKAVRETLNADIPLAADHFRYFAGCIRAQEGGISEIDQNTIAYL